MRVVSWKIKVAAAIILAWNVQALSLHAANVYTYDSLHRLTGVTYDNGTTIAYTYDAAGNRLMLVTVPVVQQAQYTCITNNATITITGYTGPGGDVIIPGTINGPTVTCIGSGAFSNCASLVSVTIPASVTNIGNSAFASCTSLLGVYFCGNAAILGSSVFSGDTKATIYYLPGTANWGVTFGGRPTALWNPQVKHDATFGVQNNCFGFTITNAGSPDVIVTACTNLTSTTWIPVATNTLTSGSSYFRDPQWTNFPSRFYRFQMP